MSNNPPNANRTTAIVVILFVLLMGLAIDWPALTQHGQPASTAPATVPRVESIALDQLHEAAQGYTLRFHEQLVAQKDIQDHGILIPDGASLGSSRSPTPGQLSALGFAPSDVAQGLIQLKRVCEADRCHLLVITVAGGDTRSSVLASAP